MDLTVECCSSCKGEWIFRRWEEVPQAEGSPIFIEVPSVVLVEVPMCARQE